MSILQWKLVCIACQSMTYTHGYAEMYRVAYRIHQESSPRSECRPLHSLGISNFPAKDQAQVSYRLDLLICQSTSKSFSTLAGTAHRYRDRLIGHWRCPPATHDSAAAGSYEPDMRWRNLDEI